jgi:hypothetical protein
LLKDTGKPRKTCVEEKNLCREKTCVELLPDDGTVLPKHVGAIVKENKEVYNFSAFSWLISTQYSVYRTTVIHKNKAYPPVLSADHPMSLHGTVAVHMLSL